MPLYDSDMAEQPTEQDQAVLFAGGERQIPSAAEEAAPGGAVRVQWIDRQQMRMAMIDVEQLIAEDHAARAIWELTGKVDLGAFYEGVRSRAGQAGRPVIDVRLLASLWIYGQSRGIHSARELEQLCQTDPAFQWLCGMEAVNYHTLSDFRVSHAAALEKLFVQVVGVLSHAGLVKLEQVMHDGTRIQACASGSSLRRQATVEQHMEAARRQLQELEAAGEAESSRRQAAARQRAAQERVRRVEAARQELEKIQSQAKEPSPARVSLTDPEARVMKHAGGDYAPSYNVQISTDAAQKVIVGVEVGQNASDAVLLKPALQTLERRLGQLPRQLVADGGYATKTNIADLAARAIDFYAPIPKADKNPGALRQRGVTPAFFPEQFRYDAGGDQFLCPAGKALHHSTQQERGHSVLHVYRARAVDCRGCADRTQCTPRYSSRCVLRIVEQEAIAVFRQKMETDQAQHVYHRRAEVAEFPNAWIKAKIKLRQFCVRGLGKVRQQALWAALTYNIQQYIRLVWRLRFAAA